MIPVVFSLSVCPNCIRLKKALKESNIEYAEMDMQSAAGITELRVGNCFAMEAPVLQIGDTFLEHDDLFNSEGIRLDNIKQLIEHETTN
jgi:glutaredoxin